LEKTLVGAHGRGKTWRRTAGLKWGSVEKKENSSYKRGPWQCTGDCNLGKGSRGEDGWVRGRE